MAHVVALDQGTTSSRAIIIDEHANVLGVAQQEFEQHYPRAGWVEHDPKENWATQAGVLTEALSEAGLDGSDISAIGITNQRETTVVWDRSTGEPIHNAIVWQDRRTSAVCDQLRADGHEGLIRSKTGLVIDAYFSGTKAAWILDHVDGARSRAEQGELAFGTIDTWLIWNLTKGRIHATDATNASRTMLFDIHEGDWDDELCGLLRVPRKMLPEVRPSSGDFGKAVGPIHAPIRGVAGDQHAALFGQACFQPGMAKCTYGTGCFLLEQLGTNSRESKNKLLTTVAWEMGETLNYALEGSVFIGGAVVQWLRDGLGIIGKSSEVTALAMSVEDNGGVYMVPAFVGLGSPHWDQYARGAILGITRGTTDAHIARAAVESIAFQVADLLEAMEQDAGKQVPELRVDGGATANDLLMQFQADLLRVPVVRPTNLETTALGAAYLAGLASGVWNSEDDVASLWKEEARFEPVMDESSIAEMRGRWNEAVKRSLGWERSGE